jgi:hypothetical protein
VNADAKEQPLSPLNSADVQARIDDERRRLLVEQNLEHDLTGQRIAPLEAGDDAALDRVEAQLNQCKDRQFRIQERLEILESRLTVAAETEQAAELDVIEARANKARELGEKLIRTEYVKLAKPMAEFLRKVRALDGFVEQANRRLVKGGRDGVRASNGVRCAPSETLTETERRRVGVGQPEHPYYGRAVMVSNEKAQVFGTGEYVNTFVEVDVPVTRRRAGWQKVPLHDEIVLGTADAEPGALWDSGVARKVDASIDAILRELGV